MPEYISTPDGMTIDSEGNLILACPNYADQTLPGCILKIDKFNITNKNPFAYFTTIVFNAFRDYFYFEKKFEIMKNISQKEYEQRFLFKYGFYPTKNNLDTDE